MKKPKVLCVDDEVSVCESLQRLLRSDFIVETSSAPEDALKKIKDGTHYDLIICDYLMPKLTGLDFFKEIKNLCPETIKIILSGQMQIQDLETSINHSLINKFILKPWDNEVLKIQMREALQMRELMNKSNHYYHLSITDPVTNLTNHRYFQERLQTEVQKSLVANTPLSLIMMDVDHFKSFNDRYGHPAGDQLLGHVAGVLKKHFPQEGLASRYGGEEFAVILPNCELNDAYDKAELFRTYLQEQSFVGPLNSVIYLTISLGISCLPQHGQSANELITTADQALYQAKDLGRNQTVKAS